MFTVILVMAAGVATGYVLRRLPLLQRVERTTSLTILLLLFILGLSVGSNRLIVDNLARFGWQAALLALAGLAGSVLAAVVVARLWLNDGRKEDRP